MNLLAILIAFVIAASASAATVRIEWNPISYTGTNVVTYEIRHGSASGLHPSSVSAGTATTVTITNLGFGPHFFVGYAVAGGVYSDPSNEIVWTNRPPPIQIRQTGTNETVTLWLPMAGTNVAAQASVDPVGPWEDWFVSSRSGPPAVTKVGLEVDARDPRRFFRLMP